MRASAAMARSVPRAGEPTDEPVMEILQATGRDDVAVVAVARFRGSDRYLVECVDGLDVEFPREEKWIANVSTQFGCPVGCPYCDAGGGYRGNLTEDELLAQVKWVLARHAGLAARCGKLKVHFARMGEPALNDAVLGALRRLPGVAGDPIPGLWACLATVGPQGREAWFDELLDIKNELFRGRFQLQFSVNSTDEKTRRELLPYPHWGLSTIARYGERFHGADDRRVVLNFALADGIPFDAAVLADTFSPRHFAVKLTPLNPTARGEAAGMRTLLRSGRAEALETATGALTERGFDVILSVGDPREDEVGSNCGQAVRALTAQRR